MTTDTVSQFEIPNDLPVPERSFERGTRRDDQPGTKSDFEFLVVCFVLTAAIFGLIHAVVYFTDSSNGAAFAEGSRAVLNPQ
jgi:hypothetical protein